MTYFFNFILDNAYTINTTILLVLVIMIFVLFNRICKLETRIDNLENNVDSFLAVQLNHSTYIKTLKFDVECFDNKITELQEQCMKLLKLETELDGLANEAFKHLVTEIQSFNIDKTRLNEFLAVAGGVNGFDFKNKRYERNSYTVSNLKLLLHFYYGFKQQDKENNKLQTPPCLTITDLNKPAVKKRRNGKISITVPTV